MAKHFIITLVALTLTLQCLSQHIARPLTISVEQAELHKKERLFPSREAASYRNGGLELPFVDDFSRYSLPTSDPSVPPEWQLWVDNTARINTSLALNPLTKGVATLEGLDITGFPYGFDNSNNQGFADTLTSCPIDLSGKTAADSVKLIFYYQEGGLGDPPTASASPTGTVDSLFLEFLVPNSSPPLWQQAWSTLPNGALDFQQVILHIADESLYLQSNFQFRFINYGRSGNVDHWHLDYVWLDDGIVDADFKIIDVSAVGHESTMLQQYNSIPWEHFQSSPAAEMKVNDLIKFRNLDQDKNISFGSKVFFDGTELADVSQGLSTALNGFSTFDRDFTINQGADAFVFPEDIADTCATFTVKYFCSTEPDLIASNDTIEFEQHFSNYYAYDDGTAEGSLALNEGGSATAIKYETLIEDTLLGLLIHFAPFPNNINNESFLLRAWKDSSGIPGEEFSENFTSHNPDYYEDGYDIFEFYEYDAPIVIPAGNFHVGFVQTSSTELGVGYDKHFDANTSNLKVKLGPFGTWIPGGVAGSIMIRPVFQSDKELGWDFVGVNEIPLSPLAFNVYPNPVENSLSSSEFSYGRTVRILNAVGAEVREEIIVTSEVEIDNLPSGIYVIQLFEKESFIGLSKFIKK